MKKRISTIILYIVCMIGMVWLGIVSFRFSWGGKINGELTNRRMEEEVYHGSGIRNENPTKQSYMSDQYYKLDFKLPEGFYDESLELENLSEDIDTRYFYNQDYSIEIDTSLIQKVDAEGFMTDAMTEIENETINSREKIYSDIINGNQVIYFSSSNRDTSNIYRGKLVAVVSLKPNKLDETHLYKIIIREDNM